MNKKLLIHACCAPCSSYVYEKLLADGFSLSGYFYNPNIHPESEYKIRRDEFMWFSEMKGYNVKSAEDDVDLWFESVKGLENEPEKGKRCEVCFRLRLEKTALEAKNNGYDIFGTVLTISPHKDSKTINRIGKELENKYEIEFLEADFKKNDGFKKSIELSRKHNLYRQKYCGCKYSIV